ncbi:DUF3834 domain-containing protein [Sulfurisphaera tokodaii]|uniref:DUF3834 domain-containing protein n=1 Tax=Sulfurisphaera tokodaii (strain DSM 16993 / JCM 10545 / NBRC 100140 / 7) TaxID=273063 RepID=Q96ZI3_SULTO|nr:DUF3834 domain-containing protein [Sulfurisphaera tokodaii]BAB66942.1 hypothetical protein STK_18510 [Sulfurisphaera tokodaii str. 7]
MNSQSKIRILAAPGPVSYPLIAYQMKNKDIEIIFGKEGGKDVDAIVDSTVSLAKRGLRIDFITVKKLMLISPKLTEGKIGVWRKGSAADVLTRATIDLKKVKAELVYSDDMMQLVNMLKNNQISAATLSSALGKGEAFEDLLNVPGSCGIHINSQEDKVINAYMEGITIIKENLDIAADYIVKNLPIKISKEFVTGVLKNAEFNVYKGGEFREFYELVKKYSNN